MQAQASVSDSLRRFIQSDVRNYKDLGKIFHKNSDELDAARQRHAAAAKSKPADCQEARNLLVAQRAGFNHVALDYVLELNLLLKKERKEIIEKMLAYMNAHLLYFMQVCYTQSRDSQTTGRKAWTRGIGKRR